ncbi:TonB-dependent receptor plug domain-containing protein [Nitrospiraceae bacterium HYJII51-Mn-bac16s-1-B09]|uniref:TonB-dependent receptor plug domain-containing protein n=1 Tax=Candidatus Manganitrophus noduliformans TaxID=2606439 RepID=A0A7X6DVA5_9BACT|nr:TonB-dependent receptor plug domain-containing protein [Candidatus Manganitrophus noduliformans]
MDRPSTSPQIGAADIERIEIVKEATSALYGSEAWEG